MTEREEPGDARAAAEKLAAELVDGPALAAAHLSVALGNTGPLRVLFTDAIEAALLAYGEQVAAPLRAEASRLREQLVTAAEALFAAAHREHGRVALALEAAKVAPLQEALRKMVAEHELAQPDHACRECMPGGEIVRPGFACYWHRAATLAAPAPEKAQQESHARASAPGLAGNAAPEGESE